MTSDNISYHTPRRTHFSIGRRPIYAILASFSVACFVGAFITDIVYWQTVAVMWETFSDWLLTAGMILAGLVVIAFLIDLVGRRRIRTLAWPLAGGYALAVLISLINAFVHSRDGYTAVVPVGLTLSALVVVILLVSAWVASAVVHRHRIGAST